MFFTAWPCAGLRADWFTARQPNCRCRLAGCPVVDIRELTLQVEHVSQVYAARFRITRDDDWQLLKLHEEVGELTQTHLMRRGQARSKGLSPAEIDAAFRAEVADVLSQVLLLAHHHHIDVVEEVRRKWLVWSDASPAPKTSSRTRPDPPQGTSGPRRKTATRGSPIVVIM
jgi:NTP pyrophosphatase (non-canonical NTP hydrolase)